VDEHRKVVVALVLRRSVRRGVVRELEVVVRTCCMVLGFQYWDWFRRGRRVREMGRTFWHYDCFFCSLLSHAPGSGVGRRMIRTTSERLLSQKEIMNVVFDALLAYRQAVGDVELRSSRVIQ